MEQLINFVYVVCATGFIFGLKLLSHPSSARRGNILSALAMFIAVVITFLDKDILRLEYVIASILVGGFVGVVAAKKVKMTAMPELVSLFNGVGGLASLAVAWATFEHGEQLSTFIISVSSLALIIGAITFSGSVIAWGKLSERLSGKAVVFKGQVIFNVLTLTIIVLASILLVDSPDEKIWLYTIIFAAFVMGIMLVLPIGGADMPVVISLLNSYSGLAACAAGFALKNNLLIVAGALVGASGIILTNIMCKAMNRSLGNVLTSGFQPASTAEMKIEGEIKPLSPEDAFYVLEAAQSVMVVPGYGMAVAQAQHVMKELQQLLESNGAEVAYAIHPVAGRMPGHMNVLLAEADVSYEQLFEMDEINPRVDAFDVAIVIGANDVVNPAAREMEGSPIYGMPVINADKAKNVFVLKRGMASGFAGIDNPLFFKENTRMIFGDAKETLSNLVKQFAS